jgi:hypothetical protein
LRIHEGVCAAVLVEIPLTPVAGLGQCLGGFDDSSAHPRRDSMSQELSLHQRRRAPRPEELEGIPWLAVLQPAERERAQKALDERDAQPGA